MNKTTFAFIYFILLVIGMVIIANKGIFALYLVGITIAMLFVGDYLEKQDSKRP